MQMNIAEAKAKLSELIAAAERGEDVVIARGHRNEYGIEVAAIVQPVDGPIHSIEDAKPLEPGFVGELIVKGPSVTKGYDRLPEADAKSKIADSSRHWHRMGDLGKLDSQGRVWFCGRMAERVMTTEGPLYTDCCEAIFNKHPQVYRSALIDIGRGEPAIVVEPEPGAYPSDLASEEHFIKELLALGEANKITRPIKRFFFEQSFPVDVRHNAKIHRLSLAKQFAGK